MLELYEHAVETFPDEDYAHEQIYNSAVSLSSWSSCEALRLALFAGSNRIGNE